MKFSLQGFEDLEAALLEIANKTTRTGVMRRALRKAAEPMQEKAKRYAPIEGGDLEGNIILGTKVTGDVGDAAYAQAMRSTRGDKTAALAAMRGARRAFRVQNPGVMLYLGPAEEIFYAKFVELGTRARLNGGTFAGTQHPGTAPQPFLRPAFDSEARPTIERLGPLLWVEIDKTAKRVAAKAARASQKASRPR
ncbi:HK97-gp10 family putative phage morphogenesis protein [Paracoccus sp. S4493]|uniref:HK97-gp10 family putative phage morphogenesis protein n=1 Tax=Paracoccus sp. S4493 TaxID=579490 RepID=UPI000696DB73|nr:HK97-gp10 family putative phage morphogenesis protein [Paracoccus sp. S4493]